MSAAAELPLQSNRKHDRRLQGWAELVARGLFATGSMRLLEAISGSYGLGPRRPLPSLYKTDRPKFVILCYHRVGAGGIPLFSSLPVDVFERQIQFICQHYRVVSLSRVCQELKDPRSESSPGIAVTFDDGYRDTYDRAFPILRKFQVPATVFLTAGAIETGEVAWYDRVYLAMKLWPAESVEVNIDGTRLFSTANCEARQQTASDIISLLRTLPNWRRKQFCLELERRISLPVEDLAGRMLTWDQIREMYQTGIMFGSHTMTHPVVSRLSVTEMNDEVFDSKCLLEKRIGCTVDEFAFPFGHKNDCGTEAPLTIERCGYYCAVTTDWGCNVPGANLYKLRRVQIDDQPSLPLFALRLNQAFLHTGDREEKYSGSVAQQR